MDFIKALVAPIAVIVMAPPSKLAPTAPLIPYSSNPIQSASARPATQNSSRARAELPSKSSPTPQLIPSHQYDLRRLKPALTGRHSTLKTTRARAEPRDFKPVHKSLPKGVFPVDEILGSKKVRGMKYYLIKWKGYKTEHNSWEPEVNVSTDLVAAFHNQSKNRKRGNNLGKNSPSTQMKSI